MNTNHWKQWIAILLLCSGISVTAQNDNPHGIVEGFWFPDVTCDLNVSWERIIFDWSQHQPNSPADWHTLNVDDRWLKAANQCNREVVALLKNTPSWATAGLPGAGVPSGLYLPVNHPDNHWANFVRQAATYYAPRGVHRFIIWNEPDISPETYGFEFDGTLEDYYQLLRVASLAAKQGNPAAQVHIAGMTYWHDINEGKRLYLDRLLERISNDPQAAEHGHYFDAVSLHIYFRTDTVYDIILEIRELLDSYGLTDKVIWVNETNAPPTQDPTWPVERPVFQYTLQQQADFLLQAAALATAAGAERVAAYKLYDQDLQPGYDAFGLLSPVDQSPRPAFASWQAAATTYTNVETATLYRNANVDAVIMTHADGRRTITAWSRVGEDVRIAVMPADETHILQAATCNGDDPAIPCPVGGPPILITTNQDAAIHEIASDGTIVDIPEV